LFFKFNNSPVLITIFDFSIEYTIEIIHDKIPSLTNIYIIVFRKYI
jgi:hypothetical protein